MNWPHTKPEIEKLKHRLANPTQAQRRAQFGAQTQDIVDRLSRLRSALNYLAPKTQYSSAAVDDVSHAITTIDRIGRWLRKEDL